MGLKLHSCSGLHERDVPGVNACPGGSAAGGDQNGLNLRSATWSNDAENQLTSRTVPGFYEVVGQANPGATVTVNTLSTYRRGEYFRKELTVSNGSGPAWTSVAVSATAGTTNTTWPTGSVLTPPAGQTFQPDADGNLTNDGLWVYVWDAENRLTQVSSTTAVPTAARKKVLCEYDPQGRRIRKTVYLWATSDYSTTPTSDVAFVYDGWNLVAEVNATPKTLVRGYVWGTDLSGSMQGAGGVGGLLWVRPSGQNPQFVAHDGNGNVVGWTDAANGAATARYEYGPFGEAIRRTGTLAAQNPFRWSTKYTDDETDLVYYGYRYYSPSMGRWISRDPIEEEGGNNLHGFAQNDSVGRFDITGLIAPHHDDPYNPSLAGKPCCNACVRKPCIISATRLKDRGSERGMFRIAAVDFSMSGCCLQKQLRWTSCIRAGHSMGGVITGCNNSTSCDFDPGYGSGIENGAWLIALYARYLSCENGVWAKHEDVMLAAIYCHMVWRPWPLKQKWVCD